MKAYEIIHEITQCPIPVMEQAESDFSGGAMAYRVTPWGADVQFILLKEPTHRDGRSLAVAAHEAFHAKRAMEGVPFYQIPPAMITHRQHVEEEIAVNAEAREWLMPRLTSDEDRRLAQEVFYTSETSYVDGFFYRAQAALNAWSHVPVDHPAIKPLKAMLIREVLNIAPPVKTKEQIHREMLETLFGRMGYGDTDGDLCG